MRGLRRSLALVALALLSPYAAIAFETPAEKISAGLLKAFDRAPDGRAAMLVYLADRADLASLPPGLTKRSRGREVYARLTATAGRSQSPLVDDLERRGAPHRAFWVVNMIRTEGGRGLAEALARRPDVERIELDTPLRLPLEPRPDPGAFEPESLAAGPEASLSQIGATDVWARGYDGRSIVIGGQDTGYQWDHPALKPHYRGWNGVGAEHNFNWHDALESGSSTCGIGISTPCDGSGHGTHTMGTMVGDDGGSNQVGVAPGAKWIGCRNMDDTGYGWMSTYIDCFEWFLAPTDLAGENANPDLAPDVISNSWTCPVDDPGVPVGLECDSETVAHLQSAVENVRAAGIVVAAAAGNEGAGGCSTISSPIAIYDSVFTIGSVTSSDSPSPFSGRGPVTVDGSDRLKPDLSAPGSSIRSTYPTNGYAVLSGTSMATPHVAGAVALALSIDPSLSGNVDAIENLLRSTAAHPNTSSEVCGDIAASSFPNNTFGAGRLDVAAAADVLLAGGVVFRDGFEFRGMARWALVTP